MQTMNYFRSLTRHSRVQVSSTRLVLSLLRLEGSLFKIAVFREKCPIRATVPFSDDDPYRVLWAVERGRLFYLSQVDPEVKEPVRVTHRVFPFWIENARRAWSVRNAVRYGTKHLTQIRAFFASFLS